MSIHKSKGLEFPVVFLCGTGKQFNLQDLNETILLHEELGFGPKVIDYERKIEYNTLAKEAIRIKLLNETLSEEMRLLYVALTRAKERLIITGYDKNLIKSKTNKENLVKNTNLSVATIRNSKSYLDWLELIYFKEELKDILEVNFYNKNQIEDEKKEVEIIDYSKILQRFLSDINKENQAKVDELLSWEYKYKESTKIQGKTSVTGITHKKDNKVLEEVKEPKFMLETQKLTAAEIGTLMHLILQKIDLKKIYTKETVNEFIQELIAKKIITQNEEKYINTDKIIKFTNSNLYKEIQNAKQVYREQPFHISLNSQEVYGIDIKEKILVQGIIDLYFINKNDEIVLLDYKTDYVSNEQELIEKYKEQLKIYKNALEQALNKKVSKIVIYSIYLNKEIECIL